MNPIDKLLNWYFRRAALPYWCMLLLDCAVVFLSGVFMYFLFHRGYQTMIHFWSLSQTLLIYLVLTVLCFRLFRTYSGIVRYSSFVDLQRLGFANVMATLLCCGASYVTKGVPESTYAHLSIAQTIAMFIIATVVMWGIRVLVKVLYDLTTSDHRAMHCLIYGTLEGGIGLAKSIRSQKPTTFLLKGFITNEDKYRHNLLMGERVYNASDNISDIIRSKHIDAVLVSPLRLQEFRSNTQLQDTLIGAGVKIFIPQTAKEWNGTADDLMGVQLKEVSVEDLLPRDEIKVDMALVERALTGKRVLITGAAGSIGSEIVRQVAQSRPAAMMLIDMAETPEHDLQLMMGKEFADISTETIVTSICKRDRMETIFKTFRPQYVFHAAAYKHVPMMEDNPSEAVQNNIEGTKVLADLSDQYGVERFVMISTDKAVNPTNVMGCSKRICEIYVQALDRKSKTQFITTRFGNVLGSNGSVIPLFRDQIRQGGPVTVTHPDIIRYFMLIPEACQLVLEAGTRGHGGEIFVFDMGQPVRIAELAQRMIRLSQAKNVRIEYTGLRAGEKLYEEVLNEQENTMPSFHEKIRIAHVRTYDFDEVSQHIDQLIALSHEYDNMATVKMMKDIVPEFKSNNSVYEALDQKS